MYITINNILKYVNFQKYEPTTEQRCMLEYLLCEFERKHKNDKTKKEVMWCRKAPKAGMCSEERSMISPDYARNFICDFILGKEQLGTQLNLF